MGVRLNKVLTELNIGLQTAIDYLKNKPSLGEIRDDANVNTKISDEQYEALVKEFKGDKDVKAQAGMIFPKKKEKDKEKPKKPEPVVEEVKEEPRQTFTPLGKIDLSQIGKPAKPKEEPKKVEPVVQKPVEAKPEPKPVAEPEVKPEPVAQKVVETPVVQKEPEVIETTEPQETSAKDQEVYKLKTEQKAVPNLNVVGKIDLDSLNQSTRPKKKSNWERPESHSG